MRISDGFNPFELVADTKSVESMDNKSVQSGSSLREKIKNSSRIKSKHNGSKSYRSASSLLVVNHEITPTKRESKHLNIFSKLKSSAEFIPPSRNREPIRITNNFFMHPIITRE
jgi:hypothetical protein